MPRKLIIPNPEMLLAKREGVQLYFRDANSEQPLYRGCKLIGDKPLFGERRAAYLSWIIHERRFSRNADAWQLQKAVPGLFQWAGECMGKEFDLAYLADSFDLSQAQIDKLIAAERAKYVKSKG